MDSMDHDTSDDTSDIKFYLIQLLCFSQPLETLQQQQHQPQPQLVLRAGKTIAPGWAIHFIILHPILELQNLTVPETICVLSTGGYENKSVGHLHLLASCVGTGHLGSSAVHLAVITQQMSFGHGVFQLGFA